MGAGQSSAGSTGSAGSGRAVETKTSYYELLSVDRRATDDEIKKAYRRKALELHPDRNYGNVDNATKLFAEIQSAYEVLSDPQERAWYDSHESAILRGDDPGGDDQHFEHDIKVTTADDIARMIRKFNSAVDFSDSPSGFFGFLRDTFEHLAREEEVAADWEGTDLPDYPSFGHKDDEYEDVVKPFYAAWSSFATRKTFAWKDIYRMSEAPDRRYRRAMEKENKRLREEGIREFNDAVRSFVAFVRKRDPRYIPSTQSEAERQKVLRDAATAQAARARAANEAKLSQDVPDWAKTVERDEQEGEIEESESEEEHVECVACRKTFKSEQQWSAHERSKKHIKAIQGLRRKMEKEDRNLNLDSDGETNSPMSTNDAEVDDEADEADAYAKEPDDIDGINDKALEDLSLEDEEETFPQAPQTAQPDVPLNSRETEQEVDSSVDEDEKRPLTPTSSTPKTPEDLEENEPAKATTQPKLGKAAQKRAKKAAAAADPSTADDKFSCASCNAGFPSKTRLFQHIKDFGHAAPKTSGGGGQVKGKKGKK